MADTERPLKNEDFRKLLATPSVRPSHSSTSGPSETPASSTHAFTHRHDKPKQKKKFRPPPKEKEGKPKDDIFDESQARLTEIMQKYRDRAEERRKGLAQDDEAELRKLAAYRILPSTSEGPALADRRMQEIQESKYLGGDIEHTHLVKGLDYSLLNKVRSEALEEPKEEQADELEEAFKAGDVKPVVEKVSSSKFVRNICRVLFDSELPKRNEMFSRGRMAYIVELDDEESDVPTTLMRSIKDCPADTSSENINADNLLINKLTQVLSYLRSSEGKKQKRRQEGTSRAEPSDDKIYDDTDDYVPSKHRDKHAHSDSRRDKPSSYFDSKHDDRKDDRDDRERRRERDYDRGRDRDRDDRDRSRRDDRDRRRDDDKPKESRWPREEEEKTMEPPVEESKPKKRKFEEEDAYAELFPGGIGMLDAGGESDDEADYSKMDMGNKKGPVKRWDFDTEEDYEKYQSGREAMPKAAYQYGLKAKSGRKTRKNNAADEKKIDQELNKINKILDDRKKHGIDADVAKRIRY